MYQYGPHIEQIKAAAEAGASKAAFDLGWCYYIGNGVTRDTSRARHWYREAASRGVAEAHEILQVLEDEERRTSELKSQIEREKQVAPQSHRVKWAIVIVVAMACLAVAGTLVQVLGPDFNATNRVIGTEDGKASEPNQEALSATDQKEARVGTDATIKPDALPSPRAPETVTTISQKSLHLGQETVADPNEDSPTARSPAPEAEGILAQMAHIAETWLEDPNGPNNPD